MNRVPSVNGHSSESVRARGGYDAYFAQTGELTDTTVAQRPAAEGPVNAETFTPADLVIGAPREPHGPSPAEADNRTTQGVVGPPAETGAAPPQASAPPSRYPAASPSPTAPQQYAPSRVSEPQPTYQETAGPQSAAPQAATRHETAQQAAQSAAQSAPAIARTDADSAAQRRQSDSAAPWVPERVDRSSYDQGPRVEVLPAALNSIELLADIAAARRAQLRSSSGVRGALNKVGFKLGLSPAEQRAEDRRARIRRQLTTTYQIAVVSVKGGVGRTTAAATLGSTFASLRPDRVVAIDANPDFGDLATRTSRHPYGLTLRDLALSQNLDAFSAVQSFTSINTADLAVIASPWTTEATEALSGREYSTAVEVLRRHYNLLMVDCGTGVLDSATATVLQTSDSVVVVTPATVGGVTGAVATLNWLSAHGLQHLIAKSIVAIVHHQPLKPTVDVDAIEKLFATAQRPTCVLPYDEHLAEGGEIDLRLLEKETVLAFEELAASLSDWFPGYLTGADHAGDRGGWR